MNFDDTRLPDDIEQGAEGGPGFSTSVITMSSGRESRNVNWPIALGRWNVGYGIRKRAHMEAVLAFFYARHGMGYGFRFKDWLDFSAENEPVALIPGDPAKRQLIKVYADAVRPYIRLILLPIPETLIVYVNGIATEDYILDPAGQIIFAADPGANVAASFEFDVPVRFASDALNTLLNTYHEGAVPTVEVVELLLDRDDFGELPVQLEAGVIVQAAAEADLTVETPAPPAAEEMIFVAGVDFQRYGYRDDGNIGTMVQNWTSFVCAAFDYYTGTIFTIALVGNTMGQLTGYSCTIDGNTINFDDATNEYESAGTTVYDFPITFSMVPDQTYTVALIAP